MQLRGGPVEAIRAGGTIWIGPGERHWHGAAPRSFTTHLAVVEAPDDGAPADWHPRVTVDEYPA